LEKEKPMDNKVKIELTPYAALTLLRFLNEFDLEQQDSPNVISLIDSYREFKKEIEAKITHEQIKDAVLTREINKLLDHEPT